MIAPRVLVTRPLPQGECTAEKLRALGYQPILSPMLRIVPVTPPDLPDFKGLQAILATSRNGIDALAAITTERSTTILTVGERTAEAARAHGFHSVQSADGDGLALLSLAQTALSPKQGPVLHVRGRDAAVSFEGLADLGFDFEQRILYESQQVAVLPANAITPPPDAALIYSARTAEALAHALSESSLDPSRIKLVGISESALAIFAAFGWPTITAKSPDEAAILDALCSALPRSPKF